MGKREFPLIPIDLVLRSHFNSVSIICDVGMPVLITHSPDDQVVPYEMGRALFEAAVEPKRFLNLDGIHCATEYLAEPDYRSAVKSILFGENQH
jgi:fermentation-respiration switch protein FrsA (DUF1100 family)